MNTIQNEGNENKPWLVHWEDSITKKWIGKHYPNLFIARKTVDYYETTENVENIYIQHIDGEVAYHRKDGEINFGEWRNK